MKIVKVLLISGIIVIALFALIGSLMPNTFEIKRSQEFHFQPAQIHVLLSDLREWKKWEPWKESDPSVQVTFGERTKGVGATQSWTSDQGNGRLHIDDVRPLRVAYTVYFNDDAYKSMCELLITPDESGDTCTLEWIMRGQVDVPVIGSFIAASMDGQVGPMFERGLEKLHEVLEPPGAAMDL